MDRWCCTRFRDLFRAYGGSGCAMSHAEKADERRILLERKVEIEELVKLGTRDEIPAEYVDEYVRILDTLKELV